MAKVKSVEKRIWDTEGFSARIIFNGRDVRSDYEGCLSMDRTIAWPRMT